MKAVIAKLIPHKEENQHAAGDPQCQPENIDEGVGLVFEKIAKCNFEMVFKHNLNPRYLVALPFTDF
jgi:hypothetical protein